MVDPRWLEAREPLSRSERAGRARRSSDPEAREHASDPLEAEETDVRCPDRAEQRARWKMPSIRGCDDFVRMQLERSSLHTSGSGLIAASGRRQPLLAEHHRELLAEFDLETRAVAGQVFRRILMAEEFLLRYLADVEKDQTETLG